MSGTRVPDGSAEIIVGRLMTLRDGILRNDPVAKQQARTLVGLAQQGDVGAQKAVAALEHLHRSSQGLPTVHRPGVAFSGGRNQFGGGRNQFGSRGLPPGGGASMNVVVGAAAPKPMTPLDIAALRAAMQAASVGGPGSATNGPVALVQPAGGGAPIFTDASKTGSGVAAAAIAAQGPTGLKGQAYQTFSQASSAYAGSPRSSTLQFIYATAQPGAAPTNQSGQLNDYAAQPLHMP